MDGCLDESQALSILSLSVWSLENQTDSDKVETNTVQMQDLGSGGFFVVYNELLCLWDFAYSNLNNKF
jgi:hypothetical protein